MKRRITTAAEISDLKHSFQDRDRRYLDDLEIFTLTNPSLGYAIFGSSCGNKIANPHKGRKTLKKKTLNKETQWETKVRCKLICVKLQNTEFYSSYLSLLLLSTVLKPIVVVKSCI